MVCPPSAEIRVAILGGAANDLAVIGYDLSELAPVCIHVCAGAIVACKIVGVMADRFGVVGNRPVIIAVSRIGPSPQAVASEEARINAKHLCGICNDMAEVFIGITDDAGPLTRLKRGLDAFAQSPFPRCIEQRL